DWYSIMGTAVMVAPGIAFSATHVIREHMPHFGAGQQVLMCIGIGSEAMHAWWVRGIAGSTNHDVCILSLQRASELPASRTFNQAKLSTRTPGLGESVVMAGFRAAGDRFERENGAMELEAG